MSWYVYVFIALASLLFMVAALRMYNGLVYPAISSLMLCAFWCFWIWVCLI